MNKSNPIKQYVKKPVVIEAVQIIQENLEVLQHFLGMFGEVLEDLTVVIHTLEGSMTAHAGDYIIKGIKGEFYPCRKDIFEESYEEYDGE